MKKLVFATTLLALGAASAFAADLGARPYTKAPAMIEPISTWAGLYIGGNVGYGWGNGSTSMTSLPSTALVNASNVSLDPDAKGVIGGGQIGYNWQMGSIVTGLEADFQGSGINGSARAPAIIDNSGAILANTFRSTDQKLEWFGTVRGRLGTTLSPGFLLYVTGGLAYGEVRSSANTFFGAANNYPASVSTTRVGWAAGAGGEWMFANKWSAKLEYLYMDLGNVSSNATTAASLVNLVNYTWKNQDHIVRAGVNYHF
jgi:outer membrane immunogenic protein